jgi:acyl-CoA synthetase (AMP-forming)/AMP-acid ligase II/aryl carrier-like protein
MSLAGEKTQVRRVWGPSECTPIATILERSTGGDIELGRGAGVCTWVTAPGNPGLLAQVGAVGELWLEGPLVGEGYLDDPQMTATAFIEDPAWLLRGIPGGKSGRRGRVFRTGKLVQYREDGSLSFVGREDTKIRGQHVDLDEVERCLRQVMGSNFQVVAEAIRPRSTEIEILATFITLEDAGEEHDAKVKHAIVGINDKLAEALPPFMIPTLYIPLQRLPKMATGKIDRTKLRALGSSLTAKDLADLSRSNGEERAPKSNVEGLLQGLWADVLKLEPDSISREDSFFRLGGDSIGAMQLVGMTRQKGLSLTVRDIFQNPILGDLAAVCTCT